MDKQNFLPNTWKLLKLSQIVKINSGIALPSIFRYQEKYDGGEIPFYKVAQMNNHDSLMTDADLYFNADIAKRENIKIFPKGSVLLPKRGGAILTNKKRMMTIDASYDSNIMGLKANNQLLSDDFLFAFLQNIDLSNFIESSTIPQINNKHIEMMYIPLPPLDEQKRLISLLDTLFAKIDRSIELLSENITAADLLLPSALNTVFGELEEKWKIVPVGQVTNCIVPQRNKPKEFIGDIPWITTDDLVLFEHISKSTKGLGLTRDSIKEVQSKTIPAESVLMSCVGDLGIVAISDKEIVVNQQLHTFQCHESLLNTYLQYALYVKKDFMYQIANITTVAYMNKAKCNSIPIPLPPLHIQTKTVEYLDSIRTKVEILKQVQNDKITHLKALKASILDRAFKGEL